MELQRDFYVGVVEDNNVTIGWASVPPLTVTFTTGPLAWNWNHMPLLLPAPKQVGGAKVPVIALLSNCPAAEHPSDNTVIANSQSLPGAWEKIVVNEKINERTSTIFFMLKN